MQRPSLRSACRIFLANFRSTGRGPSLPAERRGLPTPDVVVEAHPGPKGINVPPFAHPRTQRPQRGTRRPHGVSMPVAKR